MPQNHASICRFSLLRPASCFCKQQQLQRAEWCYCFHGDFGPNYRWSTPTSTDLLCSNGPIVSKNDKQSIKKKSLNWAAMLGSPLVVDIGKYLPIYLFPPCSDQVAANNSTLLYKSTTISPNDDVIPPINTAFSSLPKQYTAPSPQYTHTSSMSSKTRSY